MSASAPVDRRRVDQNRLRFLSSHETDSARPGESRAVRSRLPGAASAEDRGRPCRAARRWPASSPTLRTVSPTVCGGSGEDSAAMNCRMKTMSSAVTALPRYRHSTGICRQCARTKTGTQALEAMFFMRSRAATPALLPYPDYRPRAATAPDALAVFSRVRFRSATIGTGLSTGAWWRSRTPGRRTRGFGSPCRCGCGR